MWLYRFVLALIGLGGADLNGAGRPQCPAVVPGWIEPADGYPEWRMRNVVGLRGDTTFWNRRPVSWHVLRHYLSLSSSVNAAAFIIFDPTGAADCATATAVRDRIDEAGCQGELVCGQGRAQDWRAAARR